MRFKLSSINQYYKHWKSFSPIVIHQSNPQPFTVIELEKTIGSIGSLINNQQLSYASVQGDENLRTAIASIYDQQSIDNIATFSGAQEAIFCCINTLLNPGDKVVAITPIFEPLINPARDLQCDIEFISLQAKDYWRLDLNALEKAIQSGCKLLILNFPHNPTGAMISKNELDQIIQICDQNHCWILSDEVFRGLEHSPQQRLPAVADIYPRAISISVLSKAFALPAVRIGWIACQDSSIIERALEIKSCLSICNSLLDEKLATRVIISHEKIWKRNRKMIINNKQHLNNYMDKNTTSLEYYEPQAGCVCFPLLKGNASSSDYAQELITRQNLMVLPGNLFSTSLNGFRLGFGYSSNIEHLHSLM